jgi:predicted XRE-type DNA-binding protein
MNGERFDNVWDALCDTPEEVVELTMRSDLLTVLNRHIELGGWSVEEAARNFGVTRARVVDLMDREIHLFDLHSLIGMAVRAGMSVDLNVRDTLQAA